MMLRNLVLAALALCGFASPLTAVVVGEDDRRVIPTTEDVDWGTVAIVTGPGQVVCTGTSIGPIHVLTAAHCVWGEDGEPIQNLTVIPGLHMDLGFKPSTRWHIQAIWVPRPYVQAVELYGNLSDEAATNDLAVLEVLLPEGREFARSAPAHRLGDGTILDRASTVFQTIAYAQDGGVEEASQFYHEGGCVIVPSANDERLVRHDCDTGPASSGMALWWDGAVYGVHFGALRDGNRATLLTPELIRDIDSVIATGWSTGGLGFYWTHNEPYRSVDLANRCDFDMAVQIAYRNLDYELRVTELTLRAGAFSATRVQTGYDEILMSAQALDGSMVFEGPIGVANAEGEEFFMHSVLLEGARLTDARLRLPCE